jgi:hypothetical protein
MLIFANSSLIFVPAGTFTAFVNVYVIVCPDLLALPGPIPSASLKKAPLGIVVPAGNVTCMALIAPAVAVRNTTS